MQKKDTAIPRQGTAVSETVKKTMLLRKNIRAAGEFEGARPASSWIIAIKNA